MKKNQYFSLAAPVRFPNAYLSFNPRQNIIFISSFSSVNFNICHFIIKIITFNHFLFKNYFLHHDTCNGGEDNLGVHLQFKAFV